MNFRPWTKDRFMAPDIEAVTKLLQEEKVSKLPTKKGWSEIFSKILTWVWNTTTNVSFLSRYGGWLSHIWITTIPCRTLKLELCRRLRASSAALPRRRDDEWESDTALMPMLVTSSKNRPLKPNKPINFCIFTYYSNNFFWAFFLFVKCNM